MEHARRVLRQEVDAKQRTRVAIGLKDAHFPTVKTLDDFAGHRTGARRGPACLVLAEQLEIPRKIGRDRLIADHRKWILRLTRFLVRPRASNPSRQLRIAMSVSKSRRPILRTPERPRPRLGQLLAWSSAPSRSRVQSEERNMGIADPFEEGVHETRQHFTANDFRITRALDSLLISAKSITGDEIAAEDIAARVHTLRHLLKQVGH